MGEIILGVISVATLIQTFRISHFQTVSPMRKEWINDLREALSQFIAEAVRYVMVFEDARGLKPADPAFRGKWEAVQDALQKRVLHAERVRLMLNPGDRLHAALEAAIDEIHNALTRQDDAGARATLGELRRAAQAVIKDAWNQASKPQPIWED